MERAIYFAGTAGRIKVGISGNVEARMAQLRQGAGGPVKLIASVAGDLALERSMHRKLRQYRLDREWYCDCPEVRAAIQNAVNNFAPAPAHASKKRRLGVLRAVCKAIWPDEKLDAFVAGVCDCSTRTAERYLSDEIDAPAVLIVAITHALTRKR